MLQVGLYGANGHQIRGLLLSNPLARLVAVAAMDVSAWPAEYRNIPDLKCYRTLDELLADARDQLVSLCSARRRDQAQDAIRALRAGKHVYAEKPCAMTEAELDAIVAASRETGCRFHDQAGSAFCQPYWAARQLVRKGVLGEIVQVLAQKSYPYHDSRPQDEDVDGGLIAQCIIHAVRFVEHVAGVRIRDVDAVQTCLGNPVAQGGLHMAASLMMTLENGGVAAIVGNYLNPKGFKLWGNEHLRIFGTRGFLETTDGGTRSRVVMGDQDLGPLDTSEKAPDYFGMIAQSILSGTPPPLTTEEELHPTRIVIRARDKAMKRA